MRTRKLLPLLVTSCVLAALLLGAGACQGDEPEPAADEQAATDQAPEDRSAGDGGGEKDIPRRIDVDASRWTREAVMFILPAPSEIVAILGSDAQLARLRRELDDPLPDYGELPDWRAALALGRSLADLLILLPEDAYGQAEIAAHLQSLARGFEALGAEEETVEELRQLQVQVADGALDRRQLVERFDLLRAEAIRRGDEELGEEQLALIAAGSWARAVNAVSRVARETGEIPAAAHVLKLRIVVATLMDELGSGQEVQPVVRALEEVLPLTDAVRPTQPTAEELEELAEHTETILSYTRTA